METFNHTQSSCPMANRQFQILSSSEILAQFRNWLGGREELTLLGMLIVKDATNHACRDINGLIRHAMR